ncbi:MAG TPA: hypothetical protein VGV59_06390 [Pyrinomonadaceae bacterium]|nr:hypothetical protein [Pyrinomonadaceae bacterium]
MKRGIGLALLSVLSVACLCAYTFYGQHSSNEVGRAGLRAKAEPAACPQQSVENGLDIIFEEANAAADEPSPRKLAARAKSRHAAQPKPETPEETPAVTHNASGSGGGELLIAPTRGACAPDSFTVQPCSFDEWTYTFPQD